ncbi:hypothetical protein D3C80_806700 [compost metagenome]
MLSNRYRTMPPLMATRLMIIGAFQPCQMARLYSGRVPPTTGRAAAANRGPTDWVGKMPTTRHVSTSSSTGARIQRGGSCGVWGRSWAVGPKNTSTVKRRAYATLKVPARVAITGSVASTQAVELMNTVSAKNISLDRKPFISGTPAIEALATMARVAV